MSACLAAARPYTADITEKFRSFNRDFLDLPTYVAFYQCYSAIEAPLVMLDGSRKSAVYSHLSHTNQLSEQFI